jgi:BASS family bile acid:Na+ symporter
MRALLRLLTNRTFILLSAFAGGLVFSGLAGRLGGLTMPALAVVLTVSTTQLSARDFLPLRRVVRPVVSALLLNFGLLGGVILLLAWLLMPSRDLWIGYVLVAAAPPGVAIIPFTHVLRGDLRLSLQGTFALYFVCLGLTPALVWLLTGEATVSPVQLVRTMLMLVLIPFALAQVINASRAAPSLARWRGTIINWGFFVVIFTVVGLNREVFLSQPRILAAVSLPAVVSSFGLAFLVDYLGKRQKLAPSVNSSYILLSTIKTSAFAAAVGLSLYGETTSIPGAVLSAWYALYFIYLGIKGEREAAR